MFGDAGAIGCSLDESKPEMFLQGLDRPGNGRLGHPESGGSSTEMALLGDSDEILEMAKQIHLPIEARSPAPIPNGNGGPGFGDLALARLGVIGCRHAYLDIHSTDHRDRSCDADRRHRLRLDNHHRRTAENRIGRVAGPK